MVEIRDKTKKEQLDKIVNWLIIAKVKSFTITDVIVQFQDIPLNKLGALLNKLKEFNILKYNKGVYHLNY